MLIKRRGLRRAVQAAIGVVLVLFVAATAFVLNQRHVTTPITRPEALRRFRSEQAREQAAAQAPTATTSSTATSANQASSVLGLGPATSAVGPVPHPQPSHASTGPAPYSLPAEGVYAYRTTGGESISLAGASHTYPSETYANSTHAGGCTWRNEFDVAQENVDTRTLCSQPGRLLQVEDRRAVTFFGQTESEDLHCDPPIVVHDVSEAPGDTRDTVCHSSDTTAYVHGTYVGRESVTVGTASVDAVHLRVHGILKGRANGTADEQMWILPQTGLVLRWERLENADANAAFGANIHYHEHSSFTLESLTPAT